MRTTNVGACLLPELMRLSDRETTRHELRRHSLGGQGRHKQGTLAGDSDNRHPQPSQKPRAGSPCSFAQTAAFQGELWYGPRPVRRLSSSGAARFAGVFAGVFVVLAVPVALAAESPGPSAIRSQVAALQAQESTTRAQTQEALVTLYALESELTQARGALASAESRRAALAAQRISTRKRLQIARTAMRVAERRLAEVVRALYQQDAAEPLAVVLGAGSLDEALAGLDHLDRASGEHRLIIERAGVSRTRLSLLDDRLDAQAAELRRLSLVARARLEALELKASERADYLDSLRQRQDLTALELAALEEKAKVAERESSVLQVTASRRSSSSPNRREPAPRAATPTAPASLQPGSRLTVSAIGYSLRGRTSSGLPVGHGIAAVDPNVIPLGTRMLVPGYGEAVAADTGGSVRGAVIDLWFPTVAAALRWGRQTVVIELR
jgi:3D (Asp-Asp-Asp) domain-containing protein